MPRVMDIVTPLGPDVLLFQSMRSQESLGRLFEYAVTLLSTRNDIDPKQLLGKNATVKLELPSGGPRCFDGIVTRFALAGSQGRFVRYEMVMRPWLWFLTRVADCRIFQEKTVEDIIREVFDPAKYPDAAFDFQLSNSYRTWEYCVQYRETDFNFISRLMEQEGMYYYFQHVEGKHTLVIVDSPTAHSPYETYSTIPFVADVRSGTTERERISDWYYSAEVQPGKYVIDDYDFKKPYVELMQQTQNIREHEHATHEIFDFPGEYEVASDGDQYVRIRLEEMQAQHERIQALTNARGLNVGHSFGLQLHPRADQNKQYLVTSARINFASNEHEAAGSGGATYSCSFECASADSQFRTPRETPKPIVQGIQTARVVGPQGNEIWTDQYGRVKVHFHWDRFGPQNDRSTCWIRVSQGWAGKTYGMMNVPRIGNEVVVDFIEGDPDQPLITGRVYNEDQKVPYELPKYAAYETWRTRSTPGGGVRDFNELRFDDRKGKEQVFIHAQRRMDVRVKRNKYETVQGGSNTSIGGGHVLTVGGTLDLHVKDAVYAKADAQVDLGIGGDLLFDVGGGAKLHVKQDLVENALSILLEGKTSVTMKCGGSYVKVGPDGVTIQGPLVKINCGGGTPGATGFDITEPLDAAGADTGEPGYLDNLPRGGGGGRRTRHVDPERARAITRNADGSVNYGGAGVRISGSPAFVDSTIATLDSLDGTQTGHQLINNLESNGHTASIVENNAAATAGGGGLTTMTTANGHPAGVNVTMPDGTVQTSDGSGSDSTVNWIPGNNATYTDAAGNTHTQPDEALLGHELDHADHNAHGANRASTPDPADPTGDQEESTTIGINDHANEPVSENNILRDMGEDWRRTDHDTTARAVP